MKDLVIIKKEGVSLITDLFLFKAVLTGLNTVEH